MADVKFSELREKYSLSWFMEEVAGAGKAKNTTRGLRYSVCPACGPSERGSNSVKLSVTNNKWKCFSCDKKGDILDAAMHFYRKSNLKDAAAELLKGTSNAPLEVLRPKISKASKPRDYEAIQEVIQKLLMAQSEKRVEPEILDYLKNRGIPNFLVHNATVRELFVSLPANPDDAFKYLKTVVGKSLLEKSQILKEGSRYPAACYRPMGFVSNDGKSIEFKSIGLNKKDSAKSLRYGDPTPWIWKGKPGAGHAAVEGFMDLWSLLAMGTDRTIVALPGATSLEPELVFKNLKIDNILLGLDGDKAGVLGTEKLQKYFLANNARISLFEKLAGCNDINDHLMALNKT